MIFRNSKMKRGIAVFTMLVGAFILSEGFAQKSTLENSVFWEISGNGLMQPSYLFGTFHLVGSHYVDSLTNVSEKFSTSTHVVGELLLDSTITMKAMAAAQMQETTLDRLLDSVQFLQTAIWLKELSGHDLKMFNTFNPLTIQIILMTMLQQQYFPLDQTKELPMDLYFQQRAKKEGKNLTGLETFEVQVNAMYHQFSLPRQAEMLTAFVLGKETVKKEFLSMNKYYREGNLTKLEELLSTQAYSKSEIEVMLDDRNKKWMEKLPGIIREQETFIAVGALHLPGENGLIGLLRSAGYTVTPARIN
ncbi:MAG: TraB/GumN family protein [Cyclobacteriaceae bacterium]|nr:TraB/GumN family protein [Cyclobacteriaceae bacterium]MDH4294752.1 TraB/GumN family protein [Cyclobacteriaceae bacterium]MDH5248601.1 TraB/GumN family protein [Cyclobacteriaceae bacterium]